MKQFELKRTLFGADVIAQVTLLDEGLHILLTGGGRPHVGAVSVADPQGAVTTQQFPTHKDGVVSERWAQTVSEAGYYPAVVVAGIHYDDLNQKQIDDVVKLTNDILDELLHMLKAIASKTAICG